MDALPRNEPTGEHRAFAATVLDVFVRTKEPYLVVEQGNMRLDDDIRQVAEATGYVIVLSNDEPRSASSCVAPCAPRHPRDGLSEELFGDPSPAKPAPEAPRG